MVSTINGQIDIISLFFSQMADIQQERMLKCTYHKSFNQLHQAYVTYKGGGGVIP